VRHIQHHLHAPINCPPTYDNFSDDEDYAHGLFSQNVGSERRGGRHGGAKGYEHDVVGVMGYAYGGPGYRGAYGEQPMHQDNDREESCEYRMKIDLPTFMDIFTSKISYIE
jgi:hypothetical protein